jgi:hypothetical protein
MRGLERDDELARDGGMERSAPGVGALYCSFVYYLIDRNSHIRR